jgi:uncharacterized membrane protein YkoI
MQAKAAIVAGITAAVIGGGGLALAHADDGATPTGGTTQAADTRAAATISRAEAQRIALATAGGGLVREIELESEEGALVWKVEVIARGVEHDVYVDTRSGNVVRHRVRGDGRGEDARDDDLRHDVGDGHGGLRRDDIRRHDDLRGDDDHGDRHGDDGDHHGDDDGGHRHGGDDNGGHGEG